MSKKGLEEQKICAATRILNLALGEKRKVPLQLIRSDDGLSLVKLSLAFDVLSPYEVRPANEESANPISGPYSPDGAKEGGGRKNNLGENAQKEKLCWNIQWWHCHVL